MGILWDFGDIWDFRTPTFFYCTGLILLFTKSLSDHPSMGLYRSRIDPICQGQKYLSTIITLLYFSYCALHHSRAIEAKKYGKYRELTRKILGKSNENWRNNLFAQHGLVRRTDFTGGSFNKDNAAFQHNFCIAYYDTGD